MKKKLIAIAIAAAVAAPLTAQAMDMSGDARVRYYANDIDNVGKGAVTDSRIGLDIKGEDGQVAMAHVRLEIDNAMHGNTAAATAAAAGGDQVFTPAVNVDRAYIKANVGAGVTVMGGKTVSNWGHKFVAWDAAGDRVHINKAMGDMNFGLIWTKIREEGLTASTDDGLDKTMTTLTFTMGKMGGIRFDSTKDDAAATTVKRTALYGGAPLGGGWGLGFEFAQDDAGADNGQGLMLAAMGKVGGTDLTVGYASAADGFNSDDDFFTFAGTGTQAGSVFPGLLSNDGDKMTGMFVVASMKVDVVNLELGAAMISGDATAATGATTPTGDETVLSIKASYDLSKNTKVLAQYGNFSGDMMDATHMGASIETKF
jgi:hypothetical protein